MAKSYLKSELLQMEFVTIYRNRSKNYFIMKSTLKWCVNYTFPNIHAAFHA